MLLLGIRGQLGHRLGGGKTDPGKKGNGGWGRARAGEEKPVVGKYRINSGPRGHSRGNTGGGWTLGWGRRPRWRADVVAVLMEEGGRSRNPGPHSKTPPSQGEPAVAMVEVRHQIKQKRVCGPHHPSIPCKATSSLSISQLSCGTYRVVC